MSSLPESDPANEVYFAQLLADGFEILPVRFLFLFWIFAWPVVLTTMIVAVSTRRARLAVIAVYLAGLLVIGSVAVLAQWIRIRRGTKPPWCDERTRPRTTQLPEGVPEG